MIQYLSQQDPFQIINVRKFLPCNIVNFTSPISKRSIKPVDIILFLQFISKNVDF